METFLLLLRSTRAEEIELVYRVTQSTAMGLKEQELNVTTHSLMSNLGKLDVGLNTSSKNVRILLLFMSYELLPEDSSSHQYLAPHHHKMQESEQCAWRMTDHHPSG
jgi:hypothetical protein